MFASVPFGGTIIYYDFGNGCIPRDEKSMIVMHNNDLLCAIALFLALLPNNFDVYPKYIIRQ